jgi:hypothetical protein
MSSPVVTALAGSGQQPAEQQEHPRLYPKLEAWVVGYFTPMFLRRAPGNPRIRWCPQWWDHAKAIARLTVLWNGWEGARWEPGAKPGWWLDLDHHLPLLIGLDGPFRNCHQPEGTRPGKHEPQAVPSNAPAPDHWWD